MLLLSLCSYYNVNIQRVSIIVTYAIIPSIFIRSKHTVYITDILPMSGISMNDEFRIYEKFPSCIYELLKKP